LAKDSSYLNARLKEAQEEIEQGKEKLIEYQINNHRLADNLRETERQNKQLKDTIDQEQRRRSEVEVENVRQRQKMDELRT
jgi:septal ring factor EnvC (AmiA/AmiB activator)